MLLRWLGKASSVATTSIRWQSYFAYLPVFLQGWLHDTSRKVQDYSNHISRISSGRSAALLWYLSSCREFLTRFVEQEKSFFWRVLKGFSFLRGIERLWPFSLKGSNRNWFLPFGSWRMLFFLKELLGICFPLRSVRSGDIPRRENGMRKNKLSVVLQVFEQHGRPTFFRKEVSWRNSNSSQGTLTFLKGSVFFPEGTLDSPEGVGVVLAGRVSLRDSSREVRISWRKGSSSWRN